MTHQEDRVTPAILPCPFCGQPPIILSGGEHQLGLRIECETPGCVNPHVGYYDHQTAVRVWNMRAVLDAS